MQTLQQETEPVATTAPTQAQVAAPVSTLAPAAVIASPAPTEAPAQEPTLPMSDAMKSAMAIETESDEKPK